MEEVEIRRQRQENIHGKRRSRLKWIEEEITEKSAKTKKRSVWST